MTDERKFQIPLDSPLDINSNDMFVSASEPKFSFNRQRYLGSVLQNSVRYEADGWFAGWWVHNFDPVESGTINISPDTLGTPSLQDRYIPGQQVYKYWNIRFNSVNLQFNFNPQLYQVDIEGVSIVTRPNDTIVHISGTTSGGDTYDVDVNAYTGEVITGTFVCTDMTLVPSGYISDGLYHLTVEKPFVLGSDYVHLRYGYNLLFEGVTYDYTSDGLTDDWGGFLSVTNGLVSLLDTTAYTLISAPVVNPDAVDEYFEVTLQSKGNFEVTESIATRLIGGYDRFYSFTRNYTQGTHLVDDETGTGPDVVNTEDLTLMGYYPTTAYPPVWDSYVDFGWYFPIWIKIGHSFDGGILVDVHERFIEPPNAGVIESWYNCDVYIDTSTLVKSSSIQQIINDFGVEWEITIDGTDYTDATLPARVLLYSGDSRNMPSAVSISMRAYNGNADSTGFPLPFEYEYGSVAFDLEIKAPLWTDLPPPPPIWYTETLPPVSWDTYIAPIEVPPGWANPVAYDPWPANWPAPPADWENPVDYTTTYDTWASTTLPGDWANPVPIGSVPWPAEPADWTGPVWATYTTGKNFGVEADIVADWALYTSITYDVFSAPYKPSAWPAYMNWPVATTVDWVPPYPTWPFGVAGLTAWFSSTPYDTWIQTYKPATWPVTMDWPVIPEGGYQPVVGGVANPIPPNTWTPPWPPQWYYGISGLPAAEWFSATTYNAFVIANPLADWPVPWAWTTSHLISSDSTWPLDVVVDSGWVMRTGSYPYGFTVNPVAPLDWTPDWPIYWNYDVADDPPGWFSSVAYATWMYTHPPYKPVAVDWATGGDPGYAWPGQYFAEPYSAFPSMPKWEWPLTLPNGYVHYTGDPASNTPIVFNTFAPSNWPTFVTVPAYMKASNLVVSIGADVTTAPYNYVVLNRPSLFPEDEHLFGIYADLSTYDADGFTNKGSIRALFPFCVRAYTYNHVNTVDVTLNTDGSGNLAAFGVDRISNQMLGIRVFRLDDNALQPGSALYSLATIEAYVNAINQPSSGGITLPVHGIPSPFEILVMYRNVKAIPFDKTITYTWPTSLAPLPSNITNMQSQIPKVVKLQYGFYPLWIVESQGGLEFWRTYTEIGNTKAQKLGVFITFFEWFSGAAGSNVTVNYSPSSPTNDKFYQELQSRIIDLPNATGRNFPWAPGLFDQRINYKMDVFNNDTLQIDLDVRVPDSPITTVFTWVPNPPVPWTVVSVDFEHLTVPRSDHILTINLTRSDILKLELRRAFIIDQAGLMSAVTITDATQLLVQFTTGYGQVDNTGKYDNYTEVSLVMTEKGQEDVIIHVTRANRSHVMYLPFGIYWYNKTVRFISYSGNTLVFEYEGVEYTLFIGDDVKKKLVYSVVDIRDNIRRELWAEDTSELIMPVKQFWSNDVSIENFWWVDHEHVLSLSKYEFELWRKMTDDDGNYLLDDWNGDRWEVVKHAPRGNFLSSLDLYYSVTMAYKRLPVLIKMQNTGAGMKLFVIRDILNLDFTNVVWEEADIPVNEIKLLPGQGGKTLATANAVTGFIPIDVNALLCTGKITSTVIGDNLLIGLALTRGMLQWTLKFSIEPVLSTTFSVLNGYGNVGHTGNVTGGQYPSLYCDKRGFFGTVYHVANFKDYNIITNPVIAPDEKIFCSGTSIWFVNKQLTGIVSHFIYTNNDFVPQTIPLACNYSVAWGMSAHHGAALFDTLPRSLSMMDLLNFGNPGDTTLMTALSFFSAIIMPALWYMQPILGASVFASEGLHQAAYVVRNSLPVRSDDGKSDKDVSVTRGSWSLSSSLDIGKLQTFVAIIIGLVGSVVSTLGDSLKIDESKGAQTPNDTAGRKLGQFATEAILNGVAVALVSKGLVYSVKTKADEVMSLSMFYTINDGVECWAGPGFVNHNFLGQCVAQGVSMVRFKLDKVGAYIPLRFMTELFFKIQYLVLEVTSEAIDKALAGTGNYGSGGPMVLGTGIDIPLGAIIGLITNSAKFVMDKLLAMYRFLHEKVIPALYQAFGETGRGFYSGGIDKNNIELESAHSYGNKPMSMFWPAFITDATNHRNAITVESADSAIRWEPANISLSGFLNAIKLKGWGAPENTTTLNRNFFEGAPGQTMFSGYPFEGTVYMPKDVTVAYCKSGDGSVNANIDTRLPVKMSCVEGIVNMLPTEGDLKNLQVNCCDYTFPTPPIHDFEITASFGGVGVVASYGEVIAYSVDDTKLMDGPASNIVELDTFFGIASSYTAIEIKDTFDYKYLRPWAVTPTCIGLNLNKINAIHMAKSYHAFDGQFNRITSWKGGNGLDSATMVQQYCFLVNDHFKRSNIPPPSEFFGLFNGPPQIAVRALGTDKVANQIMDLTRQKGLDINIPGEDRDALRFSMAVHAEMLSTLPATIRMLAPYKLHVIDGVTSLTTDIRNTQTRYKAPSSVDFNLYDTMYRATEEYVALLTLQDGIVAVQDKVPSAGLTFIGATTAEAFFYSPATRMYYSFSGSGAIDKQDVFNRFKDIRNGRWDFINQEVIFKMLLDDKILHDDVDGYFVARLDKGKVLGEVYPPNETIYNQRSDFKILSMAGGLVYQGPKRCTVNRWILTDDMYTMIKDNKRKWKKLDREQWPVKRTYTAQGIPWNYEDWNTVAPDNSIIGWTHNPWRAATAMLGVSEETDCLYEWELTFAWTEQVNNVFEQNEYVSFNLAGETIGQGGTLLSKPTHLFLYKELFRNGYYTTRYSSKNGAGNRERLYMWGDGIVALESLALYAKEITQRRTQPLATSQVDVQELVEQ
jgi:hypothetical protein